MRNPVVSYVQGRLRAPVPLSTALEVSIKPEESRYAVAIHDDETSYLTGAVEMVDRELKPSEELQQPAAELDETLAELKKSANADLTGPTFGDYFSQTKVKNVCFGCAESHESLQLFNRRSPNKDLWTKWALRPDYTDREGQLATAIVVAGLDCSNVGALLAQYDDFGVDLETKQHKGWMTGTYGVRIVRIPPMDVPGGYRIVAHYLRTEGRKGFTMSVLLNTEWRGWQMGGDHLWEAIGAIGEIVGALAVVVTLVYLSFQLRHNTYATRASTAQALEDSINNGNLLLAGDPVLAKIYRAGKYGDWDALTDDEKFSRSYVAPLSVIRA